MLQWQLHCYAQPRAALELAKTGSLSHTRSPSVGSHYLALDRTRAHSLALARVRQNSFALARLTVGLHPLALARTRF